MAKSHENAVFISAAKKIQIEELRSTLFYLIKGIAADRCPNLVLNGLKLLFGRASSTFVKPLNKA